MIDVNSILWDIGYFVVAPLVHHFCSSSMKIGASHSPSILASSTFPSKHKPDGLVSTTLKRSISDDSIFDVHCKKDVPVPRRCNEGNCKKATQVVAVERGESDSPMESPTRGDVGARSFKVRKRPTMLVIPDPTKVTQITTTTEDNTREKDLKMVGDGYCVASRKGSRMVMEDGYEVITNVYGDSKQAYFGVFDGHGGRAAVDFACEKLGQSILRALHENRQAEEQAIRTGYTTTDEDFHSLKLGSGVCVATVLLKDGKLHAANAGDCRVVLSRNGVAHALTADHRAGRDDERSRIESMEGSVSCHNGVWRVEKSLSISRAIGDIHMKEWIISEPEINSIPLTSDCDFAIVASDGLWDKVGNQEAVDVVKMGRDPLQSCRALIEMSSSRGSRDDITVLLIHLREFLKEG